MWMFGGGISQGIAYAKVLRQDYNWHVRETARKPVGLERRVGSEIRVTTGATLCGPCNHIGFREAIGWFQREECPDVV